MKKKRIIIAVAVLILCLIGIGLINSPKALGNIQQDFVEPTTNVANISFEGIAGERIKLSFHSNIEEGNLDIVLYDANGNMVYELDNAKELETFYVFEETGTYTLEAKYTDFVGEYEIVVYEMKE